MNPTTAAIVSTVTTRRAAIAIVREEANAVIAQLERRARGWDKGPWRDDELTVNCNARTTVAARIRESVALAFALSAKFSDDADARTETATPEVAPVSHPVTDELQAAGIIAPVALAGLPEGVAAFAFAPVAPIAPVARPAMGRGDYIGLARLCNREAVRCKVAGDWQRANTWRMGRQENMRKARES